MKDLLNRKTESLSIQSLLLIMGRFLSLPISFLVPIVLVRNFSVAEFGQYKQLFMIFYLALPLMDFGITQGLIYFIPKYPEIKSRIISQFVNWQFLMCMLLFSCFLIFSDELSLLFTSSAEIGRFIPYIGALLVLWSLSNNLEILLTATKQSLYAGIFIFVSEGLKGAVIIVVALLTGDLKFVLFGFFGIGCVRLVWFLGHLRRQYSGPMWFFDKKLFLELATYSAPLGLAVVVNSMIDYSHQVIVSNQLSAVEFAIYSIGCFQIPFIGIVSMSVSRVAIVKICELHQQNDLANIVVILASSFRKLSLLFFPVFFLLWFIAPEFITLLYTDTYAASVPVFRTFIWILPLAAILVEYTPRSLGDSKYVFKVNCITLIVNLIAVVILLYFFGIAGAAAGFVLSRAARKILILYYLRKALQTSFQKLLPMVSLAKIVMFSFASLVPGFFVDRYVDLGVAESVACHGVLYLAMCMLLFWYAEVLTLTEKQKCREGLGAILKKLW